VFRRTREQVCLTVSRRHIHRLRVRPSEAEDRMHALVADFSRAARHAWRRHEPFEEDVRAKAGARWLALAVLNKRALSCARSLLNTVERRLASLTTGATNHVDDPRQVGLPLIDPDGETDDADRPPDLADFAFDDPRRERAMLRELADAARLATVKETKIAALIRFLRRVKEPAIVFTEYRDTLLHLHRVLCRLVERPAAVLHGGLSREQRAAALDDFVSARRSLLLATDAGGEGLNLQQRCRIVINLELPWSPVRLEQRIGRVDRIGQRHTVHAFHLIAGGTAESRVLERLRARIARAQTYIATADPIGPAAASEVGSDGAPWVELDNEAAIARWVVDGADAGSTTNQNQEPGSGHERETLRHEPGILNPEPLNETARLALARRFTFDRDEDALARLDAEGTWIARAACRATRMALGDRVLFIFKAALEDPAGRQIESALVPIAVDWPHGRPGRTDLFKDALRVMAPAIAACTEGPLASWRSLASSVARAFLDGRLLRERAIANLAGRSIETFQPGLFDRRAEQDHLTTLLRAADETGDAVRRIAALEEARALSVRGVRLLLVLTP